MNIIELLQDLVSHVPILVQPLIVMLAAAIPFVEGELASVLGVWAGIHPLLAFVVAVAGNFASVLVVVLFGARIRAMLIERRARRAQLVTAGGAGEADELDGTEPKPERKGVRRFKRFVVRFGVPGASILGPLAIPTQFTSAVLVSSGVAKSWVLLWQGVAIVLWTTVTTLVATGVLSLVTA